MNPARPLLLVLRPMSVSACGAGASAVECNGTDTSANDGQAFTNFHPYSGPFSSQSAVVGSVDSIESQISSGRMPEGSALSAAEQTRVLAWLACGAP